MNECLFGLPLLPSHNYWKGPWNSHLYVWLFFGNFTSNYGNCKRKKVSKPHFLGKIWFIYNISKVVYNGFQRRFLNCLESFVIRFLWKCLFSTSILQKVPIWENFSPGIMNKNISISNTADFSSLLSWLFSMIFWLMM